MRNDSFSMSVAVSVMKDDQVFEKVIICFIHVCKITFIQTHYTDVLSTFRLIMFKKKKKPEISGPVNFEHRVHTGFDHQHGRYVGLPSQWQGIVSAENTDRRRPMIDPSSITPVEIQPLKVG